MTSHLSCRANAGSIARIILFALIFAPLLLQPGAIRAGESSLFLVKDINPGPDSSELTWARPHKGILYFSAKTNAQGAELWRSDGTASGTFMVKDIGSELDEPGPILLRSIGDYLYFQRSHPLSGALTSWRSDGTEVGTQMIADIMPSAAGKEVMPLAQVKNTTYFAVRDSEQGQELWKSEGANGDLTLVKDINPGAPSSNPSNPFQHGGLLYFTADHESYGEELWLTDGTDAGTKIVLDIYPGPESGMNYDEVLNCVNNTFLFKARSSEDDEELWRSDGTTAGTAMLKDINAGAAAGSWIRWPNLVDDVMFFHAESAEFGGEIWRSDGTAQGTTLLKDIVPGPDSSYFSLNLGDMYVIGSNFLFRAFAQAGEVEEVLWWSDGTEEGTKVVDVPGYGTIDYLGGATSDGDLLFFFAVSENEMRMVRTDLTPAGTITLDQPLEPPDFFQVQSVPAGNHLFVATSPMGSDDVELWAYETGPVAPVTQGEPCSEYTRHVPIVQGRAEE